MTHVSITGARPKGPETEWGGLVTVDEYQGTNR